MWSGVRVSVVTMMALGVCAVSVTAQPAIGQDISPFACQTVWPNNGDLSTYLDELQAAGVDTVRSDAMWWGLVESTMDQYDWNGSNYPGYAAWNVDNWVSGVVSRGMDPYVILGYGNGDLYTNPPTDATARTAYADYCAAAAAQYENEVDIWEIWNEPNLDFFWGATANAASYTQLALAAAPAIRANDSTAIVVGGVTSGIDIAYLTTCFDNGLLDVVDVISVHPYRTSAPETVNSELATLRALMDTYSNGPSVEIWTGEWGYNTWFSEVNEEGHAKSLARMMVNNFARDVGLSVWFSVHPFMEISDGSDPEWALLDYSLDRRPAWYAMRTVNALLSEPVSHVSDPFSISYGTSLSNQTDEVFQREDSDHHVVATWLARWPVNSTFTAETTQMNLTMAQDYEVHGYDGITSAEIFLDRRWVSGDCQLHAFDMWDYPIYLDIDREVLPSGAEIAQGYAAVATSSNFSGAYDGSMALDGVIDATSKWVTDGSGGPHWLAVDLAGPHEVTGAVVRMASLGGELGEMNAQDVEIQVGTSISGPWTTIKQISNPLYNDRAIAIFDTPEITRYVRLLVNDPGIDAYVRIPELEIYSNGPVPAELTLFNAE